MKISEFLPLSHTHLLFALNVGSTEGCRSGPKSIVSIPGGKCEAASAGSIRWLRTRA